MDTKIERASKTKQLTSDVGIRQSDNFSPVFTVGYLEHALKELRGTPEELGKPTASSTIWDSTFELGIEIQRKKKLDRRLAMKWGYGGKALKLT
ncbi:hypothetical protein ElyMa_003000200 [Elysia marginata]|uniref:Uncharacterized protein n=1 Tax=Elysia marginata TaxID=1093978 RepID=A0AAV4IDP5_9GAST|nr:hypothetical protein ElyMa_003000200 [Elysia marginata]